MAPICRLNYARGHILAPALERYGTLSEHDRRGTAAIRSTREYASWRCGPWLTDRQLRRDPDVARLTSVQAASVERMHSLSVGRRLSRMLIALGLMAAGPLPLAAAQASAATCQSVQTRTWGLARMSSAGWPSSLPTTPGPWAMTGTAP